MAKDKSLKIQTKGVKSSCYTIIGAILVIMVSGVIKLVEIERHYFFSYYYYKHEANKNEAPPNEDIISIIAQFSETVGLLIGALLFSEVQLNIMVFMMISSLLITMG